MSDLKTRFNDYFSGTHAEVLARLPKDQILPRIQFVGLGESLPEFQNITSANSILIIADKNTFPTIGETIIHSCGDSDVTTYIFEKDITALDEHVATIKAEAKKAEADCIIALGSGTINDLCKLSAFELDIPYVIYPTAASMNGYISANASIKVKGYQSTLKARTPAAVVVHLPTIQNAPKEMTQAGIADVLSHFTANADWQLSHLLLKTPYDNTPIEWCFPFINRLLQCSSNGNYRLLMQTILLSGLTMLLAKGSQPASQSEHMIAHTMHMLYGNELPQTLHGEEIAITTLISFYIWKQIMNIQEFNHTDLPKMQEAFSDSKIQSSAAKAYNLKREMADNIKKEDTLEAIKQAGNTLPREKELAAFYHTAGLPSKAEAIGWKKEQLKKATTLAPFSRERFTCLDIALMAGLDLKKLSDDALSHLMRAEG